MSLLLSDLNFDILKYICGWLKDISKLNLITICKKLLNLDVTFDEKYDFYEILRSSFYDNYTNISIGNTIFCINVTMANGCKIEWPKKISRLTLNSDFVKNLEKD